MAHNNKFLFAHLGRGRAQLLVVPQKLADNVVGDRRETIRVRLRSRGSASDDDRALHQRLQ